MGDENRAGLFMFGPGGLREEYLVARMVKHFGPRFGIWSLVWFSLAWYGTLSGHTQLLRVVKPSEPCLLANSASPNYTQTVDSTNFFQTRPHENQKISKHAMSPKLLSCSMNTLVFRLQKSNAMVYIHQYSCTPLQTDSAQ